MFKATAVSIRNSIQRIHLSVVNLILSGLQGCIISEKKYNCVLKVVDKSNHTLLMHPVIIKK